MEPMVPERELREEGRVVIWLCSMESAYVPSEHTAHVAGRCALLQPINLEPQANRVHTVRLLSTSMPSGTSEIRLCATVKLQPNRLCSQHSQAKPPLATDARPMRLGLSADGTAHATHPTIAAEYVARGPTGASAAWHECAKGSAGALLQIRVSGEKIDREAFQLVT
jgi:hypothetical protein